MFNHFYKNHIICVRNVIEMSFGTVILLMHSLSIFIRPYKTNSAVTILLSLESRKLNAMSLHCFRFPEGHCFIWGSVVSPTYFFWCKRSTNL